MAEITPIIQADELKTSLLDNLSAKADRGMILQLYFAFDNLADELMVMLVPPMTETSTHYLDDHIALLFTPEDKEIVGYQVDAYESAFLQKNKRLARIWRQIEKQIDCEGDVGDLNIIVEKKNRLVAKEVLRVSKDLIGEPANNLNKVLQIA